MIKYNDFEQVKKVVMKQLTGFIPSQREKSSVEAKKIDLNVNDTT